MGASLMAFRHLIAYGNSDQVSFRSQVVRDCLDIMTVPGTIASYYSEATLAFVLSSQIDYLIDPRTPLFQEELDGPRASHLTLGDWHGPTVRSKLVKDQTANFPISFWTDDVVEEMAKEVISRQRHYAGGASAVATKMSRYARLLADALKEQGEPAPSQLQKDPHWILAPYFATSGTSDPWWAVMEKVWATCATLDNPSAIVPVLCVDGRPQTGADGVATLGSLLPLVPPSLSQRVFFWITNFDERKVSEDQLRDLWQVVANRPKGMKLVNMYGGFFSICLSKAGLRGFGNGLTYSESRDWPQLSATGAAPLRYYVPDIHMFLPLATAARLIDREPSFECDCAPCAAWRAAGNTIASLPYHATKLHFAIARARELEFVASNTEATIAGSLLDAKARVDAARKSVILADLPSMAFLQHWANVLTNH